MKRIVCLVVVLIVLALAVEATVALAAPAKGSSGGGGGGKSQLMAGVRAPGLASIGVTPWWPPCLTRNCIQLAPQAASLARIRIVWPAADSTLASVLGSIIGPAPKCAYSYKICTPLPPTPIASIPDFGLRLRGHGSSDGGRAPSLALLGWGPGQKCPDLSCAPWPPVAAAIAGIPALVPPVTGFSSSGESPSVSVAFLSSGPGQVWCPDRSCSPLPPPSVATAVG